MSSQLIGDCILCIGGDLMIFVVCNDSESEIIGDDACEIEYYFFMAQSASKGNSGSKVQSKSSTAIGRSAERTTGTTHYKILLFVRHTPLNVYEQAYLMSANGGRSVKELSPSNRRIARIAYSAFIPSFLTSLFLV
ncbi:MAG: hypothetical protein EZS28_021004 [Streblomastix strix]|uniref:Uncharacterized protein n=1 Tax=Streblomastix strix TaxID=222440 RepID=A0A5J4VLE8_9EUKA|nr:MAG: hypothetical protein EZS28_021004 [Streblomastix strix]